MNDKLLDQIRKLLENHTSLLRKEIQESKEELKETIVKSQEDTLEAVTDLMNSGYESHEERIKKIEDQLKPSHLQ